MPAQNLIALWRLAYPLAAAALLLAASPAFAGDLTVQSVGAPVVVLRGGEVIGTTPFTLPGLPEGPLQLGFRDAPLSATAFTQIVTVPLTGVIRLDVNLPSRIATATLTAAPAGAVAPAAPAAAPAVVVAPPPPAGDVYVTSTPPGAAIFLDSVPVTAVTPFVIRAVPVGQHLVEARSNCARGSATVTVANLVIARTELTLADRPGTVLVSTGAPGSLVFLDGTQVGTAPVTLRTIPCGTHALAIRAPGYLESSQSIEVLGDETVNVAVGFGATPAPVPPAGSTGQTVQMLLLKEEFGTLVLDVTPLETTLDVDGIVLGAGPRSVDRIAAGLHKVTGKLDGYTALSVDVTVAPEAIARANLALVVASTVPTPTTSTKRTPSGSGPKIGRIALNAGVTAVGLGATAYGVTRFIAASEAYKQYQTVPSDAVAETIYQDEVVPARIESYVGGGIGLLGIVAGTGLWITTSF